jgi:uncharacterized protein (TIRG00374 family)
MFKSKFFIYLQYLIFILASIYLINYCFKNIDFNKFYSILLKGNYSMAFWVFVSSVTVYVSRINRWSIILSKVNESIPFMNNFSSIAVGYLVSFFFPRGGEIVKCLVLKKTDNLIIQKSLISTFFERLTDIICLGLLICLLLFLEFYSDSKLVTNILNLTQLFSNNKIWYVIICVAIFGVLLLLFYKKIKYNWFVTLMNHLKEMLNLVSNIKFLAHSIFIWINYFLMTYLWFFVFVETSNLSLLQALQVSLIGSVARSIPLPGGALGAYHAAVAYALVKMNIDKEIALSLTFIIHGFQTAFTFLAGIIGIYWLAIVKKIYRIK